MKGLYYYLILLPAAYMAAIYQITKLYMEGSMILAASFTGALIIVTGLGFIYYFFKGTKQ